MTSKRGTVGRTRRLAAVARYGGAIVALTGVMLTAGGDARAHASMILQSDDKIVVGGEAWPGFAAVARFNPDGSRDRSFGGDGVLIDRRLNSLRAVALLSDGRILVASGRRFGRYLVDGRPDSAFGEGGVAGEDSPLPYSNRGGAEGPGDLLPRPEGSFFVAGPRNLSYPTPQGMLRLFGPDGRLLETAGFIPESEPSALSESVVKEVVPNPDGSLIGVGRSAGRQGAFALLARFVPGSGSAFDPAFGGGRGLVRLRPPTAESSEAAAAIGDGATMVVAGRADRRLMLGRIDRSGMPDPSFGEGGLAVLPIVGSSGGVGESAAQGIDVDGAGRLLVAGRTTEWGEFFTVKGASAPACERCLEPLVVRVTPDGRLDSSFGVGGVARMLIDGEPLEGDAEDVLVLPSGKILIKGSRGIGGTLVKASFLARLNPDGSLDPTFGKGGLVKVQVPCLASSLDKLRRSGCIPAARVRLRAGGLRSRRPTLALQVSPSLPWARIAMVRVQLPASLGAALGSPSRTHVVAIGGRKGNVGAGPAGRYTDVEPFEPRPGRIAFRDLGEPTALKVLLKRGSLLRSARRGAPARDLTFRVTVRFLYEGVRAGRQTLVLRSKG